MRVGLIWAAPAPLTRITVRYERYLRGFRALGHDPVTVCFAAAAEGYAEPVAVAPGEAALRDPEFYRPLRLDAAAVITWLGLPEVVGALKRVCPWVVSVADSDGQVSARVHPRATLARCVLQHRGWLTRASAANYWLRRYLFGAGRLERDLLDSAERADLVAINSPQARGHLTAFFRHHGRPELAARVAVVPYPVDECYLSGEVSAARERRVVAVGRWDDPQKDAPLLAAAVERVRAADPAVGFDLIGPGGDDAFDRLCRRHPRVVYHGRLAPAAVAALLRNARSLLLSSRWESGPIVANEALSLGCTLIGPAEIPTLREFCEGGRYGTACRVRSATSLAAAALAEVRAWDDGRRDPLAVAAAWRPRFDPQAVCRQLLEPRDLVWD
jgi:glycosyltransferase involved in cell wall biosynthesis